MRATFNLKAGSSVVLTTGLLCAGALLALAASARPSAAQPSPLTTRDFLSAAMGSDQFEILAAQTAKTQSHDPRVLAFAQQMIQDHTATSQALRQAAMSSNTPLPPKALSDDGSKLLAQVQGQRGVDFDQTYAKTQVLAHHQALVVEQTYARTGSNPAIRAAAKAAVPIIAQHLQMAEQLRSAVGGS